MKIAFCSSNEISEARVIPDPVRMAGWPESPKLRPLANPMDVKSRSCVFVGSSIMTVSYTHLTLPTNREV